MKDELDPIEVWTREELRRTWRGMREDQFTVVVAIVLGFAIGLAMAL